MRKNGGREWRPQGEPEEVRAYDFVIPELGRVSPLKVEGDHRDNSRITCSGEEFSQNGPQAHERGCEGEGNAAKMHMRRL